MRMGRAGGILVDGTAEEHLISLFDILRKEKNLLIPAAPGSSPSMLPLVFWPRAGARVCA